MPRNVVFFAPFPIEPVMRFVRAAAKLDDVRLLGVVHTPSATEADLFHDIVRVTEPDDPQDLIDGVEVLRRRHGEPWRIVGTLEGMMVDLARAREHFGVAGTPVKTATLFREKARMKDALRAAGLPVARHRLVTGAREALAFAEEVGFPLVIKPPAGVGARDTFRVSDPRELAEGLARAEVRDGSPVLCEEMLRGREHSFETVTTGGEPRAWSTSRYVPGCLEVLENPWIQWACVLPREAEGELYDRARDVGFAAIRALGLDDGMTHMEWFERDDGTLAVGEIAQRPPGPQLCQMTGLVHDTDVYRAWARAVIDGEFDTPWERKYAAACVFVRGAGRGKVTGSSGFDELREELGECVIETKVPRVGAKKIESYEGDGFVVVRHASTERVWEMVRMIHRTVKVHYGG